MQHRLEAVISGRVQGVMFRDFVQKKAEKFEVLGEVMNVPDGTVHVIAEGEREQLEKLIEHLHEGPLLARVTNVFITWTEPTGTYTGFTITYSSSSE